LIQELQTHFPGLIQELQQKKWSKLV
jgi:hypothetical protein